ncbi:hypothetical protein CMUS01_03364 [Colletotrichum musicola]|uniref:Uncharacterized protein n=1 Tax=Colletotrichum musicola TaxID=2175873 RepID=A0A8H6NT79_9PEZI|nr:hypothetical protein CMUS01_03364 [Colletotrichum musicola]
MRKCDSDLQLGAVGLESTALSTGRKGAEEENKSDDGSIDWPREKGGKGSSRVVSPRAGEVWFGSVWWGEILGSASFLPDLPIFLLLLSSGASTAVIGRRDPNYSETGSRSRSRASYSYIRGQLEDQLGCAEGEFDSTDLDSTRRRGEGMKRRRGSKESEAAGARTESVQRPVSVMGSQALVRSRLSTRHGGQRSRHATRVGEAASTHYADDRPTRPDDLWKTKRIERYLMADTHEVALLGRQYRHEAALAPRQSYELKMPLQTLRPRSALGSQHHPNTNTGRIKTASKGSAGDILSWELPGPAAALWGETGGGAIWAQRTLAGVWPSSSVAVE